LPQRLLISIALAAVLATDPSAQAEDRAIVQGDVADDSVDEIIVTGTLLRQAKSEFNSPLTVFTADTIRQSGFTSVSDVVRSQSADNSGTLPAAFTGGFAVGASGVSLRGLTVNSTLVLIDGRRVAPYALADDGQRSFVDLDSIPLESVDRIEVLKDGASSIYGADAIAGVVNVILKKEFRGAEVNVEGGRGQHAGGGTRRLTASAGVGDLATDRYNGFLNVEFQGDDRILAADRPYPFSSVNLSSSGGIDERNGYPGSFTGATTAVVAPASAVPGAASPRFLNTTQVGPYRPLTPCAGVGSAASMAPSTILGGTDHFCLQNQAVFRDDQPAQQRFGVSARLTRQINEGTRAYISEAYYQNGIDADGQPSQLQTPVPFNTDNIAIPPTLPGGGLNANDPFAAQGQYALIQYAFGDLPDKTIVRNHNSRTTVGLAGKWGSWDYDSALVVNHTWLDLTERGNLNIHALLAAVMDGTYNFVNSSTNTMAVRAALAPALMTRSTSDIDSLDVRVTHDIVRLPGGPASVGLGAESRYEAQSSPALDPNNSVEGVGITRASGSRRVIAGYFEFRLPVMSALSFDVSGRYDHYSDFGDAFTPKASFGFTPLSQVTFRGAYSRGFRAPSIAESGSSAAESFIPVTPANGSPFPGTFCAPTHHSAAYCLPYFVASLTSANPNIRPERSDAFTFGVVLRPWPGFSVSVDSYAIRKKGVIEAPNTGPALLAYLNGAQVPPGYTVAADSPDPAFPASLPRPVVVTGLYVNENSLQTDGIDFAVHGVANLKNRGTWTTDLSITKIFSFKVDFLDGTSQQYVGTQAPYSVSSGAGTPRYRGTWANTYSIGSASATLSTYYVSGISETAVDATGSPSTCLYTTAYCHVASFIDIDLTGIYRLTPHLTATASVQNLMDRLPPVDPADYAGTSYNPTYHQAGIIGRFFKVGVGYRF
jgi:iron complex outermembrane receptor protein